MNQWELDWENEDHDRLRFGVLRAKNLAEEIVVGWVDQTVLTDFDKYLACSALGFYADDIINGTAERGSDEVVREMAAWQCHHLADSAPGGGKLMLGWAGTMMASRALKAFSDWLQERLDALPPEAKAA